jgi:hypothetical protein
LGRIPFRVCGRRADPADSRSWTTFEEAAATFERHLHVKTPYDGVAFALGDGFAAIQLEAVFNKAGQARPWVARLVEELATYTELTPDNNGLTLFVAGSFEGRNIDPVRHPAGGTITLTRHERFVCLTGNSWPRESPLEVADRTPQLNQIAHQLRSGTLCSTGGATPSQTSGAAKLRNKFPRIEDQDTPAQKPSGLASPETQNTKHETLLPDSDPRLADQIVELALAEFRLGRTHADETFAVPLQGPNVAHMLRGGFDPLRKTLGRRYRRRFGSTLGSSALSDALNLIDAEAADCEPEQLHLRLAGVLLACLGATGFAGDLPIEEQGSGLSRSSQPNSGSASGLPHIIPSSHHPLIGNSPDLEATSRNTEGIVIDLGRADGKAIVVTASGWQLLDRSPVLFRRTSLTGQLPLPERGGNLNQLRALLNVSAEAWSVLRGWLVAALFPSIAHPILLLGGQHGTGKSTALRMLTSLVDPSAVPLRCEPHDMEHWVTMAHGSWCIALDNVSNIQPWFSDALCKAVTGDGFVRRRLYTDGDIAILEFRRVVAFTSVHPGVLAGDLADRLLAVELDPIDETARLPEIELLAKFEQLRPQLFGALLDEVAAVLQRLPTITIDRLPRMADFARILAALPRPAPHKATVGRAPAASPFAPVPTGSLPSCHASNRLDEPLDVLLDEVDAPNATQDELDDLDEVPLTNYLRQNRKLALDAIDSDPIAFSVVELMESRQSWTGTMAELLVALKRPEAAEGWPKSTQALTARLKRSAPALKTVGITIAQTRAADYMRTRSITLTAKRQSSPLAPS